MYLINYNIYQALVECTTSILYNIKEKNGSILQKYLQ